MLINRDEIITEAKLSYKLILLVVIFQTPNFIWFCFCFPFKCWAESLVSCKISKLLYIMIDILFRLSFFQLRNLPNLECINNRYVLHHKYNIYCQSPLD